MADEPSRVDVWLQGRLTGDAALMALLAGGVHNTDTPSGIAYPFVVHQFQGGADVRGSGADRIMVSGLWLVRGIVAQRDYGGVSAQIADRIDAALDLAPSGAAGADGTVFSCVREQPYRMPEDDPGGHHFRHNGGLYRVLVQVP